MSIKHSLLYAIALSFGPFVAAHAATPSPVADRPPAAWPGDIVEMADQMLKQNPSASDAVEDRRRAARVLEMIRGHDVQLYRSSFAVDLGSPESNADLRRAGLGDVAAVMRVARHYCGDARHAPTELHRCVGWLQLATKLGNGPAAYELALHYRREDQPLIASNYETQAISLGFSPPPSLDHVRK